MSSSSSHTHARLLPFLQIRLECVQLARPRHPRTVGLQITRFGRTEMLKTLLMLCFLACSSFLSAVPIMQCAGGTVASYEVAGFRCREGKLVLSNFTFSSTSSGESPQLTADNVDVVPLGFGLQFVSLDSAGISNFRAGSL